MSAREGRSEDRQSDDEPGEGGPTEAASFVAEAVQDLAHLARRHRLDVLAHLLDMAQMEAEDVARSRPASRI